MALFRSYRRGGCVLLACAALLLAGCQSTPQRESRIDSTVITTRVTSQLFEAPETGGFAIGVETSGGIVRLSGFVDNADQRRRAAELAGEVPGVKSVENNIVVK